MMSAQEDEVKRSKASVNEISAFIVFIHVNYNEANVFSSL